MRGCVISRDNADVKFLRGKAQHLAANDGRSLCGFADFSMREIFRVRPRLIVVHTQVHKPLLNLRPTGSNCLRRFSSSRGNSSSSHVRWSCQLAVRADHRRLPFSISVDKNAAYPDAFTAAQNENVLPKDCILRRVKYLNNVIEQDHRFIKKKMREAQCFKSFRTAEQTLEGSEAINMIRKGQVKSLGGSDAQGQARFVASLFQIAA